MRGAIRKSRRREPVIDPDIGEALAAPGAEVVVTVGMVVDELRERDERLLDADAERWIAEWGGDD